MPDMQMTAGYTSVLLRVDLLLSFFCLVGEERQEVIIMDKTYEMDGAGRNGDKDHMPVERRRYRIVRDSKRRSRMYYRPSFALPLSCSP